MQGNQCHVRICFCHLLQIQWKCSTSMNQLQQLIRDLINMNPLSSRLLDVLYFHYHGNGLPSQADSNKDFFCCAVPSMGNH